MSAKKNRGCLSRLIRAFFGFVLAVVLVVVGVPAAINAYVCATARPSFTTVSAAPTQVGSADAIVVLGAGINWDGSPSAVLRDRLDVAIELYDEGVAP